MQKIFRFYKNSSNEWYIDLPEWKGDASELQMVEGADKMLDMVSGSRKGCELQFADEKFEGAQLLTLIHVREPNLGGGGDYLLETYNDQPIGQKIWLCAVTEFVFKSLPQKIWFKKI